MLVGRYDKSSLTGADIDALEHERKIIEFFLITEMTIDRGLF